MKTRVLISIVGCLLLIPILGYAIIAAHDQELHEIETIYRDPELLGSYDPDVGNLSSEIGYFKIDPITILSALDNGEKNIFTPLLGDPQEVEQLTDVPIAWSQADILRIASALGQEVWDDPMDLGNDWNLYAITFGGKCKEAPLGFYVASITYFKTIEAIRGEAYTTRHIDVMPYLGMVRWGSGAVYSIPILKRWKNFDIAGAKITADEALRIADENGGKEARLREDNKCTIFVDSRRDLTKWYLSYNTSPRFVVSVKLDSGEYEIFNRDR